MSQLVTGEAVVLGLRPARLASRGLAVVVDLAVAWGTYIAVTLVMVSTASSLDGAVLAALQVATLVLVQVGIPIAVETLSHGRSLGKLICGLRVVREDGGPIRFRHALVRGAMGAIEIVMTMGVLASIASLVSARGRRLGDVFAGTLVIRERVPEAEGGGVVLPAPPPWLAGEIGGLDLSRVPDGWWLAVRQYLGRLGELDPQAGAAMAGRLAGDLWGFTGAAVPAGVDPAVYLAAVMGERQERESRRAFGESGAAGVYPGAGSASASGAVPEESSGGVPGGGTTAAGGTWVVPGGAVTAGSAAAGGAPGRGGAAWTAGTVPGARDADGGGQPARPSTGFAPPV
ncbi:RDD family protein [Streptomyces noursei]|uniref:RDD family protein n=1 Tax=Streptomyces noursei TaxID=1971 RepID=UPI001963CD0E|nr:RDD family protein [Streptomyces noursei]QRX92585.1 RDD family protein [Streptomyces noursei]